MSKYKYTEYFENEVLRKRPYLKKEWCERIVEKPLKAEEQEHNRFRFFWGGGDCRVGWKDCQGYNPGRQNYNTQRISRQRVQK